MTQTGTAKVGFNLEAQPTAGVQGVSPASLVFRDDLFDAGKPSAPAATGFDASITDFDNTDAGHAVEDAAVLQDLLSRDG